MKETQVYKLIRAHLPVGGFARVREEPDRTLITLTLGEKRRVQFSIHKQIIDLDTVASRLFIRNAVKGAIIKLTEEVSLGLEVVNGTRLPTK